MESLSETSWDILIAGTGLHESLLALALSRSEKKVLHVDRNGYYGGSEAALSLQDAEDWVKSVKNDSSSSFHTASIHIPSSHPDNTAPLSFPRAYSLALAPQIIYARSPILGSLVSSHVDQQLDFLAVGSWFVHTSPTGTAQPSLFKIPNGREDILADDLLDLRAKRGLMKFLKFMGNDEEQEDLLEDKEQAQQPFHEFLISKFGLTEAVLRTVQALVLSTLPPAQITVAHALPRIAKHLESMNRFGPGFAAVVPKWGGLAEIAQVGCRAGAVGGGVYVLGNGVKAVDSKSTATEDEQEPKSVVELAQAEKAKTSFIVSASDNLPSPQSTTNENTVEIVKAIHIVSSSMDTLFPAVAEGGPVPAVAVIALPTTSFAAEVTTSYKPSNSDFVYIMVHSSDTGECPKGQSVLYSSVGAESVTGRIIIDKAVAAFLTSVSKRSDPSVGSTILDKAIDSLLPPVEVKPVPHVLWSMHYTQRSSGEGSDTVSQLEDGTFVFPPSSLDLAFDDSVLERVKNVWEKVLGDEADGDFLLFPARDGMQAEEEEGGEEEAEP